jgi:hypothetical protein
MASELLDLTDRCKVTTTVVASPAAAAETIIAQTAALGSLRAGQSVMLDGWAAYTVGTSGSAVTFRIRQTNVSGTVVANSGALTGSQHGAGILSSDDIAGLDASPALGGQVYVLTMQVTAGAAASTVSAVFLRAFVL